MAFGYKPEDAVQVIEKGKYDATVTNCEETKSKKGKPMVVVKLKVYTPKGERSLTDRLALPSFTWKLKRYAQAIGKEDSFKAGTFGPDDLIGENVNVELDVREQDGYEPQNEVRSVGPSSFKTPVGLKQTKIEAMTEDDIPF
jgi:hypothetical protein